MSLRELTIDERLLVSGGEGVVDSIQGSYSSPGQAAAQAAVDNYGAVQGAIAGGFLGAPFGPEGALVGAGVGTIVGYAAQGYATAIANNASADTGGGAFDGAGMNLSGDDVGGF